MKDSEMDESCRDGRQTMSRRSFLGSSAAAASFTILSGKAVGGTQTSSNINLGVIGCGNRGNWIANLFKQNGGYHLHAGADYFQDRVDGFGKKFGVPSERRFTGLHGYKRLLETDVDAVAIMSPPYFHPRQALDAIQAGVHAYVAKPIAVDPAGCNTIRRAAKEAEGDLCLLVDFQTRANKYYIEALKRVHDGALGEIAFGEATYHAGDPFGRMYKWVKDGDIDAEDRLRAWGIYQTLSGDIITEQNIHTLDVMSWIMNEPPLSATGNGKQVNRPHGDCFDTFQALFEYPDDTGITFSSRQLQAWGSKPEGIRNRMFGTNGVLETKYGGRVRILGGKDSIYRGGDTGSIFKQGAVNNIETFRKNIENGKFENSTVQPSIRSTLVTFLARRAAYTGRTVPWDEISNSNERMEPDLHGLKK